MIKYTNRSNGHGHIQLILQWFRHTSAIQSISVMTWQLPLNTLPQCTEVATTWPTSYTRHLERHFPESKCFVFLFKCYWSLFPMVQLTRSHHWFRRWFSAEKAINHYLNQWWPSSLAHTYVTRSEWVIAGLLLSNTLHQLAQREISSSLRPF